MPTGVRRAAPSIERMDTFASHPWTWLWAAVACAGGAVALVRGVRARRTDRVVVAGLVVAVSALAATLLATAGVRPAVQAAVALGTATVLALVVGRWAALVARGSGLPPGVGGGRLVGSEAMVVRTADRAGTATARVRVLGDDWGLVDEPDPPLRAGEAVRVVAVQGTRLEVVRVRPPGDAPHDAPPSTPSTDPGAP